MPDAQKLSVRLQDGPGEVTVDRHGLYRAANKTRSGSSTDGWAVDWLLHRHECLQLSVLVAICPRLHENNALWRPQMGVRRTSSIAF